jgi:integrase
LSAQPIPFVPRPAPPALKPKRRILNAQSIRSLRAPETGRVDYFDDHVPGLCLRITSRDVRTWTLFYRDKTGRQKRFTLGRFPDVSLADARELASEGRRSVAKGGDPASEKRAAREALTVGELAEKYIELHAKPTKKSWAEDQRQLDADVLPRWKHRPAADITRRDVRELLDAIVGRGAVVAANRMRALLSRMFNFAVERELLDHSPVVGVTKPSTEQSRERVLSEDEIRRVWEACDTQNPRVAAWMKLRLVTAQRGGELLQMRWADLDARRTWWTIPGEFVKNGQGHRVFLTTRARAIIDGLHRNPDSVWVFPLSLMGDYKHVARRLATERRADVTNFAGHDLRRTAASFMTSGGVPRFIVKRILNHSSEKDITGVYDRYSYDPEKRAAMEFWHRRLTAILSKKPASSAGRFRGVTR